MSLVTGSAPRVLVTGGAGLLGRSLTRAAVRYPDLDVVAVARADADLTDRGEVQRLFDRVRPDVVVHAAARVGGIKESSSDRPGFLLTNLTIDANVFAAAGRAGVSGLFYLGSSSAYPPGQPQPFDEAELMQGPLDTVTEGYALSKLVGARLCALLRADRGLASTAVMASNLYGPGDTFSPARAHLVAAALAKVHAAHRAGDDLVTIWGDGTARREFTYVDDLSDWLLASVGRLAEFPAIINVGAGSDHSIDDYYRTAADVVGYRGRFEHDTSAPAGVTRKLLDSSRASNLGWRPTTTLADGMAATFHHFLEHGEKR